MIVKERDIELRALNTNSSMLHFTMYGLEDYRYTEIGSKKITKDNCDAIIIQITNNNSIAFVDGNQCFTVSLNIDNCNLNNKFRVFYWHDNVIDSIEDSLVVKYFEDKLIEMKLDDYPSGDFASFSFDDMVKPRQSGNGGVVGLTTP